MHLGAGALLCLLTWLGLRLSVGAALLGVPGRSRVAVLALDAFPPFAAFSLGVLATARPIMASLFVLAQAVGLIITDRVKRAVLHEPVMFADRAELLEVVRHPQLYIAFVGFGRMAAAALTCVVAVAGLAWLEPPLWHLPAWERVLSMAAAVIVARAFFVLPTAPALLRCLARGYERLAPSRDPAADAARFGMLAGFVIQATLARAERPALRRAASTKVLPPCPPAAGPLILIQAESYLDPVYLHPSLAGWLPNIAALRHEAVLHGRFEVPCWGANTIRTEFEVLTGISTEALGLDRFNPYEAFALTPLPSLAHQARQAGYHTVCVHPFDPSFYGRDRVMPNLGFDRFVGPEAFIGAPRNGPYVSDAAVAEVVAELLRIHGRRLFVFVITMENHGPWDGARDPLPPAPLPDALPPLPDAVAFGRWLRRSMGVDAMIPILTRALEEAGGGWLTLYGDHQPSFPRTLATLGVADRHTDYLIWCADRLPGSERILAAPELAESILSAAAGASKTASSSEQGILA